MCRTSEQYQYVQSVTVGRITIQLPEALAFPCHGHFPLFPYMPRTARYHDQRPVLSPMPSQHESRDFELFSITLPPFSPFLCSPAIPFLHESVRLYGSLSSPLYSYSHSYPL